ncbi:hypothetical protein B0T26DRAFT_192939 [Lasiosphaeria miniovina]|uniref:Uncharacterized protein n=1 Tax=Lasiosphaeria miniovina TaxID=1954250 RepID=A0AA40ATQ1_9PEZI|nr:uncharacterized protein B0T26DRAFT_192939 [Lasiosphaeria miniovina]KAK0721796.1 hypothetical protein B0T26DRAFT_192939 [Lasiosphaeria miniovina]
MSLITASKIAHRARCANSASPHALGLAGAVQLHRLLEQQQIRRFRFGRRWPSYIDPDLPRDISCRQRRLWSKLDDMYDTRLSCDRKNGTKDDQQDERRAISRLFSDLWQPKDEDGAAGGSRVHADSQPRTSGNPADIRPGQNTEDVEQEPLNHILLFGREARRRRKRNKSSRTVWWSMHMYNQRPKEDMHSNPEVPSSAVPSVVYQPDADYIIDPITNRKVPKAATGTTYPIFDSIAESPTVRAPESDTSLFSPSSASKFEDAQDPSCRDSNPLSADSHSSDRLAAELKSYSQVKLDSRPWESESGSADSQPGNTAASEPVLESEECVANHGDPPIPGLPKTGNRDDQWVLWSNPVSQSSEIRAVDSWMLGPGNRQYPGLHKPEPAPENDALAADKAAPQDHDDLADYTAVRSHEPDGNYNTTSDPMVSQEELSKYQPFRSHEPDGKYAANNLEELAPDAAELASYSKPFLSHEPDGIYAAHHAETGNDMADLDQYQAFRSHEPDGKYAARNNLPDVEPADLSDYGKYAVEKATSGPENSELGQYQAVRSYEPNGKYAADAEPTAETSGEASDLGYHEAYGYEDSETSSSPARSQGSESWPPSSEDLLSSEPKTDDKTHYQQMLETLMARSAAEPVHTDTDRHFTPSTTKPSENTAAHRETVPKVLTGNYVRDFPEDFARSWSSDISNIALKQQEMQGTTSDTVDGGSPSKRESVLQPALDRLGVTGQQISGSDSSLTGPSPTEPELASLAQSPCIPVQEATTTVYKILVYDPTMQCIDVGETTSIVPDIAAPLTPAEVLLRISNPAKFFPHFAPLQAQGFEIVSGGGDILIFRKVRDAVVMPEPETLDSPIPTNPPPPAINPIDMTGGTRDYNIAAGRFASPTGFVNYDLPPLGSVPPAGAPQSPRFESGIDVRREEPVFSGQTTTEYSGNTKEKTRSLPKRLLLGAAWVGGISYSLGVVADYFKTGGSDGKGPKGFASK